MIANTRFRWICLTVVCLLPSVPAGCGYERCIAACAAVVQACNGYCELLFQSNPPNQDECCANCLNYCYYECVFPCMNQSQHCKEDPDDCDDPFYHLAKSTRAIDYE